MRKHTVTFCLFLGLIFLTESALAAKTVTEVTHVFDNPLLIVNKLLYVASFIIGAILFFMGISQYKIHKKTPKLVPLTTPIFIWILSLVCLLLPFFGKFMDKDSASPERREAKKAPSQIFKKPKSSSDPRLIVPGRRNPPSNDPNRTYDSPYNQPNQSVPDQDKHWSDEF